jgi:probable HAF family extracellular repeat protein
MALADHTNLRRVRLCVAAAVVLAALAAPMAGASAQSLIPGSRAAFLLDRGRYTTIKPPSGRGEIISFDINDRGQIVGQCTVNDRGNLGFVRDRRGRINIFSLPGARGTKPLAMNNRGQIVGRYSNVTPIVTDDPSARAFLLDRGRLIQIRIPGATEIQPSGINDRGQVVGQYVGADGRFHGFLWHEGRLKQIDVPGSAGTSASDINDRGDIVGAYSDDPAGRRLRGFLLSHGVFTTLAAPAPRSPPPPASTTTARSRFSPSAIKTGRKPTAFCSPRGSKGRSRESISRARREPWPSTSTTRARSSARTRTPRPRQLPNGAPCSRR